MNDDRKRYRVQVDEEVRATTPREALRKAVQQIQCIETFMVVECLDSEETHHFSVCAWEDIAIRQLGETGANNE